MPVYRDKRTGRWRFEFDRYVDGERRRVRKLLPAGWSRAQAEAYDRQEGAALYAIAAGIAKPRHNIDEAVYRFQRERIGELKAGANVLREFGSHARLVDRQAD